MGFPSQRPCANKELRSADAVVAAAARSRPHQQQHAQRAFPFTASVQQAMHVYIAIDSMRNGKDGCFNTARLEVGLQECKALVDAVNNGIGLGSELLKEDPGVPWVSTHSTMVQTGQPMLTQLAACQAPLRSSKYAAACAPVFR